ncbi:hypothetical protein GN956_G21755 [Arapaima gigas]
MNKRAAVNSPRVTAPRSWFGSGLLLLSSFSLESGRRGLAEDHVFAGGPGLLPYARLQSDWRRISPSEAPPAPSPTPAWLSSSASCMRDVRIIQHVRLSTFLYSTGQETFRVKAW